MPRFLRSPRFWLTFATVFAVMGAVYAWEIGLLSPWIPAPHRMPATRWEGVFSMLLVFLFALNAGLYVWRRAEGSCPIGTRRATGLAGVLGMTALLCPACTVIPLTLMGTTLTLGFLSPFIPLLRIIALILAGGSLVLLWPRKR